MGALSSPIGGLRVHTKITPLVFTLTSISRLSLVRFQPFLLEKLAYRGRGRQKGEGGRKAKIEKFGEENDEGQRRTNYAALKIVNRCNSINQSEIVISKPIRGHFGVITEHI